MPKSRRMAEKVDLNHLHLHVQNLNRAKRFYESYFQFHEHMRYGDILFLRNAAGFELALVPDRNPSPFPDWFHFGFRLSDFNVVRKLHRRMKSNGVLIEEVEDHNGYVTFRCVDPDNYSIEVYCT